MYMNSNSEAETGAGKSIPRQTNYPNWYIWNHVGYSLFSHTYQNFLVWFVCLNAIPE